MKPYLLQHFLEESLEKHHEKKAIKNKNESISFKDLFLRSSALGYILKDHKACRNDRIGILLDKSIFQVISLLGVLYSDCVFVIVNNALHEREIKHILNDCNVNILLSSIKYKKIIDAILNETEVKHVLMEEELDPLIRQCIGKKTENINISDDISNIIYTSGSTGKPKGIVITHRNLIDGALIVSHYLKITENEKILGLLPFNFDYGLNQLTSTLFKGCTIILFQFFMPNPLLKILQEEEITGLAAIPPVWASVFNPKLCKIEEGVLFSKLRYITNSGGKLPVATVKKIRDLFKKTDLYLMYGLTEAFRSTYLPPEEVDAHPDSIGKAIPNVQVEVINEKGEICSPGETGELIHRGACIARGYWNNPDKTNEVYKPNPLLPKENQFLETVVYSGDYVKKDEDGFLYFIGRKDNMIKTGGYRVSPTEVEELLMLCKGVYEAVVFGLPDDELGQKIRALATVSKDIGSSDIINFCKKEAPSYLVPKEIFIVEKFPKTASGKLDRPLIIKESIEKNGN